MLDRLGHRLTGATLSAAAVGICLAIAGSSVAAGSVDTVGKLRYVRHAFQTKPSQEYLTVKAKCPRGTHVTGGGEVNDGGFGELNIVHTYPVDRGDPGSSPDDGWAVLLHNQGSHSGKVHAICTKRKVRYATETFQIATGAQNEFDLPCPAGTKVLSGGTRGPRTVIENSLFPVSDFEWGGYVENHSATDKSFTQTAVCAKVATTIQISDNDPIDPETRGSRSSACPGSQHVYGGGQDNSAGFDGIFASAMSPTGSDHDAWRAAVDNFSASFTFTVRAYAVCGPAG